jgi:hypothetical protein
MLHDLSPEERQRLAETAEQDQAFAMFDEIFGRDLDCNLVRQALHAQLRRLAAFRDQLKEKTRADAVQVAMDHLQGAIDSLEVASRK